MIINRETNPGNLIYTDVIVTRTVDGRRHMHGGMLIWASHRVCGDFMLTLQRGDEKLTMFVPYGEVDIQPAGY